MADKKNTAPAQERVTIKLPKDKDADPRGEYVAINGVAMFIPRNKVVEIPKPYYDELIRSMQADDDADDYIVEETKRGKVDLKLGE